LGTGLHLIYDLIQEIKMTHLTLAWEDLQLVTRGGVEVGLSMPTT